MRYFLYLKNILSQIYIFHPLHHNSRLPMEETIRIFSGRLCGVALRPVHKLPYLGVCTRKETQRHKDERQSCAFSEDVLTHAGFLLAVGMFRSALPEDVTIEAMLYKINGRGDRQERPGGAGPWII